MSEMTEAESIEEVYDWISDEHEYARAKWPIETHNERVKDLDGPWRTDVGMYLHRAKILGLDNPLGRQAMGKALMTLHHYTEAMVREFGPMPPAGVPSGEMNGVLKDS